MKRRVQKPFPPPAASPSPSRSRAAAADFIDGKALRRRLLAWFDREQRAMPWRGTKDPYRVWVSEIMLQQTQVATVIPYYERFLRRFATLESLAGASEDDVLALWAGLGYYSRARHLLAAARAIRARGSFPSSFEDLLRLPGLGRYTAGAVGSIVFGLRVPCIDGNVTRVAARLLALKGDPRKGAAKKTVEAAAAEWLDPDRPGDFNQAMMELGAVVCARDAPYCLLCPLGELCRAHERGLEADIPPRRPSRSEPRVAVIGVCRDKRGRVLIAKRPPGGMFAGLWEFPGGAVEPGETHEEALVREFREEVGLEIEVGEKLAVIKHAYTRFRVTLHAFSARVAQASPGKLGKQACLPVCSPPANRVVDGVDPSAGSTVRPLRPLRRAQGKRAQGKRAHGEQGSREPGSARPGSRQAGQAEAGAKGMAPQVRWAQPSDLARLAFPAANRRLIEILGAKKNR